MLNLRKLFHLSYPTINEEETLVHTPQRLPLQNMFYGLGFIILFFWILKTFRFIFITITLSIFSCLTLLPIIHFISRRTKINKTFISAIISLLYTLLLVLVGWVVFNNLLYFFNNLSNYENQLNHIINDIISRLNLVINDLDNEILPSRVPDYRFNIRDYILSIVSFNFYLNSANIFLSFMSGALLVFIFIFFILNEAEKTNLKLEAILKGKEPIRQSIRKNVKIISAKISRYLQLKTIISFLTSFFVWLILSFYQVESPLTWAFFTFAFNFIPNIGSIAITLLIFLMSVIQFYPIWDAPIVIGLFISVIQILIGNILDPKLQGDQLDLSPLLILISLAFWGYLWGVLGMFLAVPLLEVLRITSNNIQGLQPFAIFISSGKKISKDNHRTEKHN